uniref:Putative tail tube protein n=1 Tax=viral metagenome TaxID=1070528 RepID=A0A6H1ZU11_9ZZZZ
MAKISGVSGSAVFNSITIKITNWNLDIETEEIDTTDSGDATWKSYITSGFKSWNGKFEGFQETTVADPAIGTSATLTLALDGTMKYAGSAYILTVGTVVDVPGAEAVRKTYSFRGTGTLTYTVT